MASPQPDKFTSFSNELLEAFIQATRFLSPYESAVWLCVLRKTYGYKKKEDWIALSQINLMTGIARQHISRTITKLNEKNMIIYVSFPGKSCKIGIQKDYSCWVLPIQLLPKQVLPKQVSTVTQIGNSATQPTVTQTGNNKRNKRKNTKERRHAPKKGAAARSSFLFNPAYSHIDIPRELHKMDAWLAANPGRKKTERFIINWLNRIEPNHNTHKERPKV